MKRVKVFVEFATKYSLNPLSSDFMSTFITLRDLSAVTHVQLASEQRDIYKNINAL
jgi:hypothetical protein